MPTLCILYEYKRIRMENETVHVSVSHCKHWYKACGGTFDWVKRRNASKCIPFNWILLLLLWELLSFPSYADAPRNNKRSLSSYIICAYYIFGHLLPALYTYITFNGVWCEMAFWEWISIRNEQQKKWTKMKWDFSFIRRISCHCPFLNFFNQSQNLTLWLCLWHTYTLLRLMMLFMLNSKIKARSWHEKKKGRTHLERIDKIVQLERGMNILSEFRFGKT